MSLFRRRTPAPYMQTQTPRAIVSNGPAEVITVRGHGPMWGTVTGWKAAGHGQHASEQTGAFAGQLLSQTPVNVPGVQLCQGVEYLRSSWYYPTAVPVASQVQQTQHLAQVLGAQQYGSRFSGPIGPITARRNAQRVADAQVRQTGAQAMSWARQLVNGFTAPAAPPGGDSSG